MPVKINTAAGFSNMKDVKVSNGDGTYTNLKELNVKTADGFETVWRRDEDKEEFQLAIDINQTNTVSPAADTTAQTFYLPTNSPYAYDWNIDWGDGSIIQHATGTGTATSAGIAHTYPAVPDPTQRKYTITITPAATTPSAWLRAFGWSSSATSGSAAATNKNRIVSPLSKITPLMFFSPIEIAVGGSVTVNNILYYTFYRCIGYGFTMGANFGFSSGWSNITTVGNNFCSHMFGSCSGNAFTMNDVFTLINVPWSSSAKDWRYDNAYYYNMFAGVGQWGVKQPRTISSIVNGVTAPTTHINAFGTWDDDPIWTDYEDPALSPYWMGRSTQILIPKPSVTTLSLSHPDFTMVHLLWESAYASAVAPELYDGDTTMYRQTNAAEVDSQQYVGTSLTGPFKKGDQSCQLPVLQKLIIYTDQGDDMASDMTAFLYTQLVESPGHVEYLGNGAYACYFANLVYAAEITWWKSLVSPIYYKIFDIDIYVKDVIDLFRQPVV